MEQTQTAKALKTDQTQFFLVLLLQEEVEQLTKEHLGGLEEELHTIDQHHLKD
jgi:hypothetical protein